MAANRRVMMPSERTMSMAWKSILSDFERCWVTHSLRAAINVERPNEIKSRNPIASTIPKEKSLSRSSFRNRCFGFGLTSQMMFSDC